MLRYLFLFNLLFLFSCQSEKKLPFLGNFKIENEDTIFATVPDFELFNQDGQIVNLTTFSGQVQIATFFFTSCPSICPKVMRNMMRIEEKFRDEKNISLLAFSLDYKRDSLPRLKEYRNKIGIDNPRFQMLQGKNAQDIRNLLHDYMSVADDDPETPGGINHSGWILLVDRDRHLRSYALGTDDKDVDRFMKDISLLIHEMYHH